MVKKYIETLAHRNSGLDFEQNEELFIIMSVFITYILFPHLSNFETEPCFFIKFFEPGLARQRLKCSALASLVFVKIGLILAFFKSSLVGRIFLKKLL